MMNRLRQQLSAISHPLQRLSTIHLQDLPNHLFQTINEATGLVRVEELKLKVHEEYIALQRARELVQTKKTAHSNALENKAKCQVEINSLLQRKNHWTATDLARFTALCQTEHELENAEKLAKEDLSKADGDLENKQLLYDSILRERYQEEIILGERNKGISNILTWGLLILNTCIFLYSQLITEPRRLKQIENRLAASVEVLRKPITAVVDQIHAMKDKLETIEATIQAPPPVVYNAIESSQEVQRLGINEKPIAVEEDARVVDDGMVMTALPVIVSEEKPPSILTQLSREENVGLASVIGVCSIAILAIVGGS